MKRILTVTLLLFATPAMAQYAVRPTGPTSFGSPPPPPAATSMTCTQTCVPLGTA
jgi:hypothetical protein